MSEQNTPKPAGRRTVLILIAAALLAAALLAGLLLWKNAHTFRPGHFNPVSVSAQGGKAGLTEVNLRSLSTRAEEEARALDIIFKTGSGMAEQPCGDVPEYTVDFLPSPLRMRVTLKGLTYSDYMLDGLLQDPTGLVAGMFQMNAQGGETVLYFNLTAPVTFDVSEKDGTLSLRLKPGEAKENESWFLLTDQYYDYQNGTMPEEGFTPTLCDDQISVLMISGRFSSEEAAQKERDRLLTGSMEGREVRVVSLTGDTLPPYNDSTDAARLLSESILSVNGAKITLPLFYADARFLCWTPDRTAALFAKPEDGGEKLYVADTAGTKHLLCENAFSTVVKACYSFDGSTVAFSEQDGESEIVTVVDTATGKTTAVGTSGDLFGPIILGLALNDNGQSLYVLSGDGTYTLCGIDLKTGENEEFARDIIVEGDLVYKDEYLYYCSVEEEYEDIVRLNVENGICKNLCHGSQFMLSPDGRTLAYIVEDYETAVMDLNVLTLETGETATVLHDVSTSEFFVSPGSEYVFYVQETGNEEYYYEIMRYGLADGQTTVMAQSINAVFFASDKPNAVVVSVNVVHDGEASPVTYLADFDLIERQLAEREEE